MGRLRPLGARSAFRRTRRAVIITLWRYSHTPLRVLLVAAALCDPCLRGKGPFTRAIYK